jgi:hypothetical protein
LKLLLGILNFVNGQAYFSMATEPNIVQSKGATLTASFSLLKGLGVGQTITI